MQPLRCNKTSHLLTGNAKNPLQSTVRDALPIMHKDTVPVTLTRIHRPSRKTSEPYKLESEIMTCTPKHPLCSGIIRSLQGEKKTLLQQSLHLDRAITAYIYCGIRVQILTNLTASASVRMQHKRGFCTDSVHSIQMIKQKSEDTHIPHTLSITSHQNKRLIGTALLFCRDMLLFPLQELPMNRCNIRRSSG